MVVKTAATWLLTPIGLFGVLMLAMAASPDKMPPELVKKFHGVVGVWSKVVGQEIPPPVFLTFFGICQLSGVLALHGAFGSALSTVANGCFLVHLSGAVFTRVQLGEPLVPPIACLGIAAVRLMAALAGGKGEKRSD
mmetsp:Transcript_72320/g.215814  ORF Transcript_72320/g.215814 Transcript_72320/m.215814 type:complete len:137 (+) Transcript_72320:55-465(+)|eukprot:CAMPEP_0175393578 /NCGR_PEP_ID=MMETSP0095-20121207/33003_1 /TAXON_ID=311494 /ORGANISM="Alexandrium monilatum, Strain CCMP3105" /LENGTH=136 /DNA_ID=CAMNT_0016692177 /DNA_START=41 /DNA_END=451 /DNA_ORIENTATION=+